MDLRDARFDHAKGEADLFHRQFLVIIQGEDHALLLGKRLNGVDQHLPHLSLQATEKRVVFGGTRDVGELIFSRIILVLQIQTSNFKPFKLPEQELVFVEPEIQLVSDLRLGRRAPQPAGHALDSFLHRTALSAKLTRAPVQDSQRIQDGAADSKLCVALKLHLLGVIKLVIGIDQTNHPR